MGGSGFQSHRRGLDADPSVQFGCLNNYLRPSKRRVPVLVSAPAFALVVAALHGKTHGFQARGFPILPQQAGLAGNCSPVTAAPRQCRTTRRPANRKIPAFLSGTTERHLLLIDANAVRLIGNANAVGCIPDSAISEREMNRAAAFRE